MKKEQRRRLPPFTGYMGFGNRISAFTNKPNPPFRKIKQIYGDELERLNEATSKTVTIETLTEEDRLLIRNKVRDQMKRECQRNILTIVVSTVFVCILLAILNHYYLKYQPFK